MANIEYLGFLGEDNLVGDIKEISLEKQAELEVLRAKIESGSKLSEAEINRCSTELLALFLEKKGIKVV